MKLFKNWNLNKTLITVAIVLGIIAVIVAIIFLVHNKNNEINYEDTVTAKNLFVEMTVNLSTKETKKDNEETTFKDEFQIDDEKENLIFSSQEEFLNFFSDTTFDIEIIDGIAHIKNDYQTKKIIVEANEIKGQFINVEKTEELGNDIYILSFDTQKRTKEAFEYLSSVGWIKRIELDKVIKISNISDESQTVYEKEEKQEGENYKSYGVKAMGLDNYQNIIQENGNPSDITIATIGYGAAINNSYFDGRISEESYNFIENSPSIYETIPQGSRILEVIKESTTHNIKIMSLMIVNGENYTTLSSIVKAINYATQKSDVICYELVHEQNDFIDISLKNAFKENVPVCTVTSAEVEADKNYPANNSTTIAVTSLDKSSNITNFSGSGDYVDFAAFSTDVEEIFNTSSSVSKWSGAEYSNAHIASAIALIKTYHKEYTILEIYNMIRNYCKDLGKEGKDDQYGYGCPNFSELKISDIDKTNPEMEDVVYDNEKWEKTKEIQIKAKDQIRILGWAVTTSEDKPKELNKLATLSANLDIKSNIEKNGRYFVWVSDSAGNMVNKAIEISKVDNTEPKIQYTMDTSKLSLEKYVTINVTATDDESGLQEMAYSWDGINWGKDNNILKVTENGKHTIYVRDNMENIAKKEITVNSFPKEGTAIIEEGAIIKEIVVSPEWNGNINSSVRITFKDNLKVADWKITESSEVPSEYNIDNNHTEYEDEPTIQFVDNTVREENTNSSQGYMNYTITVSLSTDRQYFLWVKDTNGKIDAQSFRITK